MGLTTNYNYSRDFQLSRILKASGNNPDWNTEKETAKRTPPPRKLGVYHKDLLKYIQAIIEFPESKICKHYIAGLMLSLLEESGYPVSKELAGAVVNAEDEEALRILSETISRE